MSFLPVAARELAVQSCKRGTHWTRLLASGFAVCIVAGSILLSATPISTAGQGKTLFGILSAFAFGYSLLVGAAVSADCLSEEKREGTLGLLFLTHLKGFDVVAGKLVSSSIHAAYGVIAVVPMMSLALLFGGVSPGEVARTAAVLGNALYLSLSAGVFVSSLSRNERRATLGSGYRIYSVGIDGDDDIGLRAKNLFTGSPPVPDGDIGIVNDH